jgi:hypothetical protein
MIHMRSVRILYCIQLGRLPYLPVHMLKWVYVKICVAKKLSTIDNLYLQLAMHHHAI